MTILYLTDYFYPFVHGGAETSVLEIAKALVLAGQKVIVLTPNYGAKGSEVVAGVKIERYLFPKQLPSFSSQLTIAWHFNPLYWVLLTYEAIVAIRREKVDIIHCQSVTTVIPAIVAGKLLRKPVVLTFRDSQILCNYGWCLTNNQFGKTCNFVNYFTEDFIHYYQDKVPNKNIVSLCLQLVLAVQGRMRVWLLRKFASFTDRQTVASDSQRKTFRVNGFPKGLVIANVFRFPKRVTFKQPKSKTILYATKLSPGKGLDVLLEALPLVLKSFPKASLLVLGGGDIQKYQLQCKKLGLTKSVSFLGRKDYDRTMEIRKNSLLEVAPSVYPESFGRSALEALACGVPVVSSNRGGLRDIVENGVTGYSVDPTKAALAAAIIKGIRNNKKLRMNIHRNFDFLRTKYEIIPVKKHLSMYKSLV